MKDTKGITEKKENFSEWFPQVIQKADLADYTQVSGCIVFKPNSWAIWEKIQQLVNERLKPLKVQNVAFPLFINESLLNKEAQHVEGFTPEVAWVTHAGNTKLNERLAVRPTSEAIIYDSYSKWIRSHKDLPLKYNQWSNVVRWEFKHPTPLLRTREFFFNEGHTVFATQKEAEAEQKEIIGMYKDICDNHLALPSFIGKKSEKEKFAGAEYTVSMEFLMPNGKSIQGPDFHHDGQNFAKAYDIKFVDQKEKEQYAWQNTWAISSRMLGVMFAIHGDDQGLILPPNMAPTQIVIVPILFDKTKKKVLQIAQKIKTNLEKANLTVHLDNREDYSPGWKFNEWEVKGIPLRIEFGPKDLEKNQVMLVRRDTQEKQALPISAIEKEVQLTLQQIQDNLFKKANKQLKAALTQATTLQETKIHIKNKKIVLAPFCNNPQCEEKLKEKLDGAKTINQPQKQPKLNHTCIGCKKPATTWIYFGKSY